MVVMVLLLFFFSSRRRHTSCALVTGFQTFALPIYPLLIEDVLLGCAYPEAAQGNNIARIASFLVGLPKELGGASMNRFCGSSMYALHVVSGQIAMGAGDAFIACGVEIGRAHV